MKLLRSKGFEVFYPVLLIKTSNGKAIKAAPYFPGYLFVKFNPEMTSASSFQWIPYTTGLICFGDQPASVPSRLVQAIQQHVEEQNFNQENSFDSQMPAIQRNPDLIQGTIFDSKLSSGERSMALLSMLQGINVSPERT